MKRNKVTYTVFFSILVSLLFVDAGKAQLVSEEQVVFYTREWEGERDDYGRPLVPDAILERMEYVVLEEAWGTIRNADYHNKFEGDWEIMYPDRPMVGRALTAVYMPESPDLESRMDSIGRREEGLSGPMNQWPIYMLEQGDVYVADGFGKVKDGTLIGDNLGQSIYSNSGNGPVIYGSARDLAGLREIEGFNAWVKAWHPSYLLEMMLMTINGPARIGEAIALPGDVVLATESGVLFIPPHLAETVVLSSEVTRMTDTFRISRMEEGVYTLEELYGNRWTEAINEDFYEWVNENRTWLHEEKGVGDGTIDNLLETRSRNWRQWLED